MDFEKIIEKVVEQEGDLIGPVAVRKADSVDGVEVSEDGEANLSSNDGEKVLSDILESYSDVVGKNAVDGLKRNVAKSLDEVPEVLEVES